MGGHMATSVEVQGILRMGESGRLFIAGMRAVPKKPLSRMVRRLASVPSKMAVRRFAARYGAAVEEAEKPLEEYESVLDFFTRRLKPGLRPIDADPKVLVSPVDGCLPTQGPVEEGLLLQAKGRRYRLSDLLAEEGAEVRYRRGAYFTFYLAPKDYHRIHAPVSGFITEMTYVPGQLYPVNPAAVAHVEGLFAKNERLITHLQSEDFGRVAVVKVGATCVGHIKVTYEPEVTTNVGDKQVARKRYEDGALQVKKGQELGVFEMGSTVIVVVERAVALEDWAPADPVRMGMRVATLAPDNP